MKDTFNSLTRGLQRKGRKGDNINRRVIKNSSVSIENMAGLTEKITGAYHFLTDRVPSNTSLVNPKPRTTNPWLRNDQAIVSKVKVDKDLPASLDQAIDLLGDLGQSISPGDKVLVKPNFNSPDPYPGSTDLSFLRSIVERLLDAGAKVTIGESSGGLWRPTRNVFHKLGVFDLAKQLNVQLIAFEDEAHDWVRVKIDGSYLHIVTVPRSAYHADKIVYLPCPKTHNLARFSGTLKLAVGFMHPGERRALHMRHLEQKVAEISLCWQPNLIIMDCRKVFVSGGPNNGELVEPGLLLASGDPVAIDIEAIKILLAYQANNSLAPDPLRSSQIATALRHGLSTSQGNYVVAP
jgi:uncharacterized protein (DUF362 family)